MFCITLAGFCGAARSGVIVYILTNDGRRRQDPTVTPCITGTMARKDKKFAYPFVLVSE